MVMGFAYVKFNSAGPTKRKTIICPVSLSYAHNPQQHHSELHFLVLVSGCEVSRNSGLLWALMTPLLPDVKAAIIGGSFIRHISEF